MRVLSRLTLLRASADSFSPTSSAGARALLALRAALGFTEGFPDACDCSSSASCRSGVFSLLPVTGGASAPPFADAGAALLVVEGALALRAPLVGMLDGVTPAGRLPRRARGAKSLVGTVFGLCVTAGSGAESSSCVVNLPRALRRTFEGEILVSSTSGDCGRAANSSASASASGIGDLPLRRLVLGFEGGPSGVGVGALVPRGFRGLFVAEGTGSGAGDSVAFLVRLTGLNAPPTSCSVSLPVGLPRTGRRATRAAAGGGTVDVLGLSSLTTRRLLFGVGLKGAPRGVVRRATTAGLAVAAGFVAGRSCAFSIGFCSCSVSVAAISHSAGG